MLTVYSFPEGYGQPSLSPFCTKVLVHLTLVDVPYVAKLGAAPSSPTKKLPYIRDGQTLVGDSAAIIQWVNMQGAVDLDAGLSEAERGLAHLVKRTLEEHLYFSVLHSRWVSDEGWRYQRSTIAPIFPVFLRPVLPGLIRRRVKRTLSAQGLGLRPSEAVLEAGARDIQAIEAMVQGGPFFFGSSMTAIDIVLHAFVGCVLANRHECIVRETAHGSPRLRAIVDAVERRFRDKGGQNVPMPS